MIAIYVKSQTKKQNEIVKEKFHSALVGSPAYINSEIAICDEDDTTFILVVGNNNEKDIEFTVISEDLTVDNILKSLVVTDTNHPLSGIIKLETNGFN